MLIIRGCGGKWRGGAHFVKVKVYPLYWWVALCCPGVQEPGPVNFHGYIKVYWGAFPLLPSTQKENERRKQIKEGRKEVGKEEKQASEA